MERLTGLVRLSAALLQLHFPTPPITSISPCLMRTVYSHVRNMQGGKLLENCQEISLAFPYFVGRFIHPFLRDDVITLSHSFLFRSTR